MQITLPIRRILHIGNGNEKHRGRRFYDVGRKLQHGLIRNELNALFLSDRDLARTQGVAGTRWKAGQRVNGIVLETARNFRPEMVLLGHAAIITNDTLLALREMLPGVRIAEFNVDPVFRPENDAAIRSRMDVVDASFITTGGEVLNRYLSGTHQAFFIPNPVDAALESYRCHEVAEPVYDVFYAVRATTTSGSQEDNDRLRLPRYVRDKVDGLRCHFFGFDGVPELFGAAFYDELSKAVMGLNLSHKQTTKGNVIIASEAERFLYASDRLAQYMGCGLLTFSERGFALERMFEEDGEMVFFENREELADKLAYYKAHPQQRQRIAHAGWQKVHQEINATLVARYIVEKTIGVESGVQYGWEGISE